MTSVLQQDLAKDKNIYESKKSLFEYLQMHFGTKEALVAPEYEEFAPLSALEFPARCSEECVKVVKADDALPGNRCRALDVGCAVGRSTFEMARYFEEVVGMDFSQAFIDAANELKKSGEMEFEIFTEGVITKPALAKVDPAIDRTRTSFQQGDACNLDVDKLGGKFGVILAANLLCRLPKPRQFLDSLPSLLVPGGYLVMPSPYTWLEAYTRQDDWVGGYYDKDGKPVKSFDALKAILGDKFDFVHEKNMPFFIYETARKNQWTVSHCTIWKLKA